MEMAMVGAEAGEYLNLIYIFESLWQRSENRKRVRKEARRPFRRPLQWAKEQVTEDLKWSSGVERTWKEQTQKFSGMQRGQNLVTPGYGEVRKRKVSSWPGLGDEWDGGATCQNQKHKRMSKVGGKYELGFDHVESSQVDIHRCELAWVWSSGEAWLHRAHWFSW